MDHFLVLLACFAGYGCSRRTVDHDEHQKISKDGRNSLRSVLFAQSPSAARFGKRVHASSGDESGHAKRRVSGPEMDGNFDIKQLAGVTAPVGFFDPVGFTSDKSEGKVRFYREVELKHGRLGMLAALGFLVGENFHPLFGGNIDDPAYLAFQQTPLQTFWPAVVTAIAILEVFSVFSFNSPAGGEPWSIRSDHVPGDLGFDPLNLKPTDPEELKTMQTKELNNGRLAMLAAAGMIAQELATGQKLF
mmetsp:Transcript_27082/g.42076  ORF Transcript_27082/g.42076 Transcript_27082/m.42076 type:complete len:247 (-) Transcript_27082:227-967(-)